MAVYFVPRAVRQRLRDSPRWADDGFLPAAKGSPREGAFGRKRIYLKDMCDRYSLAWQWDHISQTVDLKIDGINVRLLVGSSVLLLGKEQVRLNTPVLIDQSSVMLSLMISRQR